MLLNGGELDGARILGTKTVELMRQNHLPPNIPSIAAGSIATGYGLGVSVTLNVGEGACRLVGHRSHRRDRSPGGRGRMHWIGTQ